MSMTNYLLNGLITLFAVIIGGGAVALGIALGIKHGLEDANTSTSKEDEKNDI